MTSARHRSCSCCIAVTKRRLPPEDTWATIAPGAAAPPSSDHQMPPPTKIGWSSSKNPGWLKSRCVQVQNSDADGEAINAAGRSMSFAAESRDGSISPDERPDEVGVTFDSGSGRLNSSGISVRPRLSFNGIMSVVLGSVPSHRDNQIGTVEALRSDVNRRLEKEFLVRAAWH
eukprot:gnl/TRDRNA2_/TRDRNA2_172564_c0_seq1.p1 gnl/TRDRNA2_/TRDRNA2_172564_c0~~gnl/TRDRNA2_/TRDRNA2_172564_c0_seq1.p1  ORF type:complete len:173 (-),score=23.04 gnl/TRDRNA2_/TRDRNA2_172564_c0_seq1:129-647(-)